jgi:hypothetical protein
MMLAQHGRIRRGQPRGSSRSKRKKASASCSSRSSRACSKKDGALRDTAWETSADEILGSKYFGVGMHYDIGYGIERDPQHDVLSPSLCGSDVYIKSYTAVKAHVLTKQTELMVVDAAVDTRDGADPPSLRAKIIGHDAFKKQGSKDDGGSLEWNVVDTSLDWAKTQKVVEFTYWLGPVPLTLEAGFAGRIGVDVDVYAGLQFLDGNNCIDGYVRTVAKPLASVSGYLFAGISLLDQIKAGVRGFLTIIEIGVPLETKVTLGLSDANDKLSLELGVENSLSVDVTTLSGRLEVYAKAFVIDWSKTLVSWPGITDSRSIFRHRYEVPLLSLHNAYAFTEKK